MSHEQVNAILAQHGLQRTPYTGWLANPAGGPETAIYAGVDANGRHFFLRSGGASLSTYGEFARGQEVTIRSPEDGSDFSVCLFTLWMLLGETAA